MAAEFDILEVNQNRAPLRVDRERSVIHGCKLLGADSKNGYVYPGEMRERHLGLYEGAKCNLNHPPRATPGAERSIQDRFGVYRNCTNRVDGVYGDLHFNPKHGEAEAVCWYAEHMPEALAFSHNARGQGSRKDAQGRTIIESLVKVRSVDLVADGGSTTSLFESERDMAEQEAPANGAAAPVAEAPPVPSMEAAFMGMQHAIMNNPDWSDDERLSMLKEMNKFKKKVMGSGEEEAPAEEEGAPAEEAAEGLRERPAPKLKELAAQKERLERELSARKLCRAMQVEDTDPLVKALCLMESEDERKGHLRWLKGKLAPPAGTGAQPARPGVRSQSRGEPAAPTPEARRVRNLAILRGG